MDRSLLFGASALGVAGWLLSLAIGRTERDDSAWRQMPRPLLWTTFVLPVLVFLVTLPGSPPFSAGQGLGRGFLIGAVAALLSALTVVGVRRSDRPSVNAAVIAAPLWLALPAATVPVLFMRDTLMDALMGIAIGILSVTIVLYQGLSRADEAPDRLDTRQALLSGAGYMALVAVAAGMGTFRGHEITSAMRWATAAILSAAAVPLAVWVGALPPAVLLRPLRRLPGAAAVAGATSGALKTDVRREVASTGLRLVLGAAVILIAGRLIATRLLDDLHAWYVAVIGLAIGFLVWWLGADSAALGDLGRHRRPLAILITLGAAMAAFNLLLGFGMALMSLALWVPLSLALCGLRDMESEAADDRRAAALGLGNTLWAVAAFTAAMAIYRFVATRYQTELRGVVLTDHYALFGFLAGASIPAILAGVATTGASAKPAGRILRLAAAGLLALAVPGLILVLWKAKAALALLTGAALAAAGFDWLSPTEGDERSVASRWLMPLMALAVCLVLAQWTPRALDLASLTRDQKVRLLSWLLLGIACVLIAVEFPDRIARARMRRAARMARTEAAQ